MRDHGVREFPDTRLLNPGLLSRLGFRQVGPVTAWSRAKAMELPATLMRLSRAGFAARHSMTITTARLQIDRYRAGDLPELHRIVMLPEVARMLLRFSPDTSRDEVATIFSEEALAPPMRLVVRHDGKVVGSVGMSAGEPPSIHYFLDPAWAGKGLGQEMVGGFVSEVIARFDPPQLRAQVFDDNPASSSILRRLGFNHIEDQWMRSLGRDGPARAGLYRWRRPG